MKILGIEKALKVAIVSDEFITKLRLAIYYKRLLWPTLMMIYYKDQVRHLDNVAKLQEGIDAGFIPDYVITSVGYPEAELEAFKQSAAANWPKIAFTSVQLPQERRTP